MTRLPPPWSPEASTRQRVAPLVALVVLVAALVYGLMPFTFAGRIECSGSLFGSEPAPGIPAGAIVGSAEAACADTGGRRRNNVLVVGAAALALGLGGAFLPSDEDIPKEG